jgi:hypothetical protein
MMDVLGAYKPNLLTDVNVLRTDENLTSVEKFDAIKTKSDQLERSAKI